MDKYIEILEVEVLPPEPEPVSLAQMVLRYLQHPSLDGDHRRQAMRRALWNAAVDAR